MRFGEQAGQVDRASLECILLTTYNALNVAHVESGELKLYVADNRYFKLCLVKMVENGALKIDRSLSSYVAPDLTIFDHGLIDRCCALHTSLSTFSNIF